MNIPQLHTNLLWDLSCLTIFLTGLYFSCIIFFRSPFWKSITTTTCLIEWGDLGRSRICSLHKDKRTNDIDRPIKRDRPKNVNTDVDQEMPINDIEVDYEAVIDPALEKQIHEILESYAREQREKEIIFYGGDGEEMLDFGNISLPTAKFYTKKEHKRVKLLHAISELGDLREVPLLQGMLNQERNESISILIKEIILGFLSESRTEGSGESKTPEIGHLCEHYVYKYLFRAIDTESKHLLLDEILNIGGAEELVFLRGLSQHPDEGIREKARFTADQLEQKLRPPQHDAITTESKMPKPKETDLKNRFLSHLSGIRAKIRSKFSKKNPIIKHGLNAKGKSRTDILQIDFELDMPPAEDREID